ncbi:MAG: cobalamin-binding protein [Candidatus Latescibacterota bacterium]|nr:MAG: cobalamin-binding protein [Candidatus Latescibacterota bacterium]
MEILKRIADGLERGEPEEVLALTREAIAGGVGAARILDEGLVAGMNRIGERFKAHEIFLPDVLLAAKAMYAGMDELKPFLQAGGVPRRARIVLGSVEGDLHDIGKNLVGIMLRGAGFDVIDLGHDVSAERFVETAEKEGAAVIGMSALLTTTMLNMRKTVRLLEERSMRGRFRVIVGGAPVSSEFAREIGADAYAYDAANAVDRVRELVGAGGR